MFYFAIFSVFMFTRHTLRSVEDRISPMWSPTLFFSVIPSKKSLLKAQIFVGVGYRPAPPLFPFKLRREEHTRGTPR